MANPQAENGHVDIANEIVEALAKTRLSSYESQILWAIFRKTYGWHKKEDWINNTQITEMTGIAGSHVSRTIKILVKKNLILKNSKKLAFQKDYDKWEKLPKGVTSHHTKKLPKGVSDITKGGKKSIPKGVYTKETKETIQKKLVTIHFNYKEGKFIGINNDFKSDLKKRYPNCDIDKQFRKMTNWLVDNQNKKRQGKRSFIDNWMERDNQYQKEREESGIDNLQALTGHLKEK